MIVYGCAVGSWDKLRRNVTPWVEDRGARLIAVYGQPSMSVAGNTILDGCIGRGFDAVILVHDDLEILDPRAEQKLISAMDEDVALVGVAGSRSRQSLYWWEQKQSLGHQFTDSGIVDFGERTGDAAIVEGSIMVFSPWAIENLRFDERYTDFRSGYDDICLAALDMGKRNVVANVDTLHHTQVGWRSAEVRARFEESEQMFRQKWGIK